MREILFRGKRISNGGWVYGGIMSTFHPNYDSQSECDFFSQKPNCYCICANNKDYYVEQTSIGQYTGLTDKNGSKIFEGDICRFREWANGDMCWIGKVHYEHQQFVISGNKNKECESSFTLVMTRFISENIEVIGNSIDNPELLQNT